MNQAWSYKIHYKRSLPQAFINLRTYNESGLILQDTFQWSISPPQFLNTEGSCLVGWSNVGGILVKLLPGTYNIVHEIHKCCQLSRPHGNWSVKFTIFLSAPWHRMLASRYKTLWGKSELSQFGTVPSESRSNSRFEQVKWEIIIIIIIMLIMLIKWRIGRE